MFFKCKHPANRLAVKTDSTEERIDADFTRVIHHLFCQNCMEDVNIKYAKTNGGVEAFLKRGSDAP